MSQLRSIVERIERLNEEERAIKSDKRDVFAEAKSAGFDPKALRKVIALRAKEPSEVEEENTIVELYLNELGQAHLAPVGIPVATHARVPREADKFLGRANAPAAAHEDGAVIQAGHDVVVPARAPASVHLAPNDRKSSPAQTEEEGVANAGNEAPPMPAFSGREPYQPKDAA